MPEHGGFELTNGRALDTLENFSEIVSVMLDSIKDHPKKSEAEDMFGKFQELAKKAFALMTFIKSQKRRSSEDFMELLVHFMIAWEKTFPDVACFNKLHHLMWHFVEFIDKYGACGQFSSEGHEALHAKTERIKGIMGSKGSTRGRFEAIQARSSSSLKPGVIDAGRVVDNRMRGKKRREIQHRQLNNEAARRCKVR